MHPWQKFRIACCAGRLEAAKALVAEHGFQVYDGHFEAAVIDAAGVHGHLAIGQWAVAEHSMDLTAVKGIMIFDRACENGHLHVCQWLPAIGFDPAEWVVTTTPEVSDQPSREELVLLDRGFESAVKHRHWPVASWLMQRRPEHSWPAAALCELIAHSWGPTRDAWMRSVVK